MPDALPITFERPLLLAFAAGLTLLAIVIAAVRRAAIPRSAAILFALGLLALAFAAGGIGWRHRDTRPIAVVLDLTPSTRTATFRDPAQRAARIEQLLAGASHTLIELGSDRSTQTSFNLPDAALSAGAILLLSDARFSDFPTPARDSPPVYPIIDPALQAPADAAVEQLERRGEREIAVTVRTPDAGPAHQLRIGGAEPARQPVAPGQLVIAAQRRDERGSIVALIEPIDPWPENNSLALRLPAPERRQRWFIGRSDRAGAGWRHIDPGKLPADGYEYLNAGVIVIDNLAADELDRLVHERLEQYVRDLGGGLVILGGDRAFAAGGYTGTALDRLSPLASNPPRPTMHWILLADSSGSMAQKRGDNSRWHFAANALIGAVSRLPPDDPVSIGNFAAALRWWHAATPARELQRGLALPSTIVPTGPTNLGVALKLIAETTDPAIPTQLLLITDAEAKIDNPASLAAQLAAAKVRVWVLATGPLQTGNIVRSIAERTGGAVIAEDDPRRWADSVRRMLRSASPDRLNASPLTVRFSGAGPRLADQTVALWNRTWLKPDASELARGAVADAPGSEAPQPVPAVAAWNLGSGAVIAAAFAASPQVFDVLAERVANPPRDPRFTITVQPGPTLTVTLDAADPRGFINGLAPRLQRSLDDLTNAAFVAMPQVAPGRYTARLDNTSASAVITLFVEDQPIDRFAVAGRYAPEFEAIGNDRAAMERIARDTGGAVIEPARTRPIDFHWPVRTVRLSVYAALAGAALVSAGLIRWRLG